MTRRLVETYLNTDENPEPDTTDPLTTREREVVRLVAAGQSCH